MDGRKLLLRANLTRYFFYHAILTVLLWLTRWFNEAVRHYLVLTGPRSIVTPSLTFRIRERYGS